MRESSCDRIEITETRASTFRLLLQYIYTGKINLREEQQQQQQQQQLQHQLLQQSKLSGGIVLGTSSTSGSSSSSQAIGGEDALVDLLGCAHKYGFVSLQHSVSDYLESILDIKNVCSIYDIAALYQLDKLVQTCIRFIDRNCVTLIKSQSLLALSEASLAQIIGRDSFCAPEIEIFHVIKRWHEINK